MDAKDEVVVGFCHWIGAYLHELNLASKLLIILMRKNSHFFFGEYRIFAH